MAIRSKKSRIQTVQVELGNRSYPVVIGAGVLDEVGTRVAQLVSGRTAAVVTNPTVAALYLGRVRQSLHGAGFEAQSIEIPDGEEHKNATSLASIYDQLIAARVERGSPIVALGGGVIGDLSGFAAATFLRGVPFVQVPTTLLAQVDASIGGKTAINHPAGKNLIGAFYQPRLVLIDVDTLKTLPRRELLAGVAEVIKYGAILDAELFELLERRLDDLLSLDPDLTVQVVQRCCALKALVVQRDEQEADYRAILNFGHTVGHAIESLTAYQRYLHGEAVAIGMAFAARLSVARGYCSQEVMRRVVDLLKRAGLPVDVSPDLSGRDWAVAMGTDKKVAGRKVKFVCLNAVGSTRFEYLTVEEIAAAVTQVG